MDQNNAPIDWQISRKEVRQRAQYLLETGQWSDCKFLVGSESNQQVVEAHKLFLAISSPVFEAMFFGNMAEKNDTIPILDVQPDAFKALLEYIYTDNININSFDKACELCYCAKKYMLPHLVEKCTKFLWSDLHARNAVKAYEFAKLFEEPVLMDKCRQIICSNTIEVLNCPSFEDIEPQTLVTIFEQELLTINSELDLFDAAVRYAQKYSADNQEQIAQIPHVRLAVQQIRFLTLTPQEFAEGPAKSNLLTQTEAFAILMNISSPLSDCPMPEGFTLSTQRRTKYNRSIHDFSSQDSNHQSIQQPSQHHHLQHLDQQRDSISRSAFCPVLPQVTSTSTSSTNNNISSSTSSTIVGIVGNVGGVPLTVPPPVGLASSSSSYECRSNPRDLSKYICLRPMVQQTDCLNASVLDCSVTFTVDKNICVTGVQVPTQVTVSESTNNSTQPTIGSYTDILYAHLLDADGSRLTYTHYTARVGYRSLQEISFNRAIYIQRNKIYKVGVVFNKVGWYPMGACSQRVHCESVLFNFCVGQASDSVRDGLIRSIVFG